MVVLKYAQWKTVLALPQKLTSTDFVINTLEVQPQPKKIIGTPRLAALRTTVSM